MELMANIRTTGNGDFPPRGSAGPGSTGPPPLSRMRLLFLAAGVGAVVFGAYEVAELAWLAETDPHLLPRLLLARGIFASLAVATVVALALLHVSPPWLAQWAIARAPLAPPGLADTQPMTLYARWFIALRWLAVMVAGTLLFVGVAVMDWVPAPAQMPLTGLVAALAVCNLFYTLLVWQGRGVRTVLQTQGYVDLAMLILLLHYSGGVENPLAMVMVLHVIIGGILLSKRQCYGLAAAGSLLFGFMAWMEWSGVWAHHSLRLWLAAGAAGASPYHVAFQAGPVIAQTLLQSAVMLLTAYFVATMAERLRVHESQLLSLAAEARSEQQLLVRALATTGTALRVLDPHFKTGWSNELWHRWFGATSGLDSAATRRLDGPDCPARLCLQDGQARATELAFDRVKGGPPVQPHSGASQCVFQITTAPLTDSAGRIHRVVELAQDITQHKETQAHMVRASRLAALGELAGQVVHEVNNPVTIISGKARLLLTHHRAEMSPAVAQELTKITETADRVARLTRSLLASGRPSTSIREQLDLRVPARKALAMIEAQARRIGVQIHDALPETMPSIEANAQELEQVFLNLYLNALDAMPRGGRLKVSAPTGATADHPGRVAVAVEDTGGGIPADLRERIFEAFFTTKPEGCGSGLGLSTCRGLVRSHQGEIAVRSAPGEGACFVVQLPIPAQPHPTRPTPHD